MESCNCVSLLSNCKWDVFFLRLVYVVGIDMNFCVFKIVSM